jgi:hypothetical protein
MGFRLLVDRRCIFSNETFRIDARAQGQALQPKPLYPTLHANHLRQRGSCGNRQRSGLHTQSSSGCNDEVVSVNADLKLIHPRCYVRRAVVSVSSRSATKARRHGRGTGLTGLHAHFEKARAALMRVSALLQGRVAEAAEQ